MIHKIGNDTIFVSPFNDKPSEDSLEFKLRYNQDSITKSDMYVIASILHSFSSIIMKPTKERNIILSKMKKDGLDMRKNLYRSNKE